jgi:hypothetical protein
VNVVWGVGVKVEEDGGGGAGVRYRLMQ